MSAKEEKEKKETREEIERAAKSIIKRARLSAELFTQVIFRPFYGFLGEKMENLIRKNVSIKKDFLSDGIWELKLVKLIDWKEAAIRLLVSSAENPQEKEFIYLSEKPKEAEKEILDALMRFENSWREKVNFLLATLTELNNIVLIRASDIDPKITETLIEILKKAQVQYEADEKLETLTKENEKLRYQFADHINFMSNISTELIGTKKWFKSKEIAKIRAKIDRKNAEISDVLSGVDPELLKEWTREWAADKLNKIKELNEAKGKKAKREALREVLGTKDLIHTR